MISITLIYHLRRYINSQPGIKLLSCAFSNPGVLYPNDDQKRSSSLSPKDDLKEDMFLSLCYARHESNVEYAKTLKRVLACIMVCSLK
jgi:hypothetical protein